VPVLAATIVFIGASLLPFRQARLGPVLIMPDGADN
jgi:hypothetical protein